MESLMAMSWSGLLIVGLGTMFLIGEILVNVRGLFAVSGIALMTYYFYYYTVDPAIFSLMIVIYFVSLLLILIDGKIVNDGMLAGLGIIGMIITISLVAPNFSAGLYAVIGIILGIAIAFSFLKVFPRRKLWSKVTLKERLTAEAGYSSINESYADLVGKTGTTLTDMRPTGMVILAEQEYSAVTNGQWINKDTPIEVVAVDGTKILVKEIEGA